MNEKKIPAGLSEVSEALLAALPSERDWIESVEAVSNLGAARVILSPLEDRAQAGRLHTVTLVSAAGMIAGSLLGGMSDEDLKGMADSVAELFANAFAEGKKKHDVVNQGIARTVAEFTCHNVEIRSAVKTSMESAS